MATKKNKIEIILITGFLGSGKTTFLNRAIDYYRNENFALIINDFGEIAVDGILLQNQANIIDDLKIYEISNGSIFCSCLSAELVKALKFFTTRNIKKLIIETSGLSDPSTFNKILTDNKLEEYFDIKNSVCIVDTIKTMQLFNRITAIEKQITSSNIIIANKADLISEEEKSKLLNELKKINDKASVVITSYANVDFQILEENKEQHHLTDAITCNTVSNRPATFILKQQKITFDKLEKFYAKFNGDILRIKGFVKIDGKPYYVGNNNNKLQIEKRDDFIITEYGLSVIARKGSENRIKSEWKRYDSNNDE